MPDPSPEIDTSNDFLLGSNGDAIAPMLPVVITSREQAYRTAAWLELMAPVLPAKDPGVTYEQVRAAVANT